MVQPAANKSDIPFDVRLETLDAPEWDAILERFDDATLYQTRAYGEQCWGRANLAYVVVKEGGRPVAAAQLRLWKKRGVPFGIAYVPWGPVWRPAGEAGNPAALRRILSAIAEEFGHRRGMCVRVAPQDFADADGAVDRAFDEAGYLPAADPPPYRTFRLDLGPELEGIRKSLDQKWRNQLNRAEKNGLTVESGTSGEEYRTFLGLMRETLERKAFRQNVSYDGFGEIQESLPDRFRMRTWIARLDGIPVCAAVASRIGDRGIYIFGATGEAGLKAKGSYLLQWEIVKWLKTDGARFYDLGGIDPDGNPGVHHFKAGLEGDDVSHLPVRHFFPDARSRWAMSLATAIRNRLK
jgi:lipid II:glycine glycyltransferase (peptidoglycan interpeptide bridge formation enzyme)